jgi:hypothetical protein
MAFFTPAPREAISQGDIFRITLSAIARFPLSIITGTLTVKGNTQVHTFEPLEQAQATLREAFNGTASIAVTRGILLSHDCEIDNEDRYRAVALLRPIGPLGPREQEAIRNNADNRFFYVPAVGDLPESYADLRRITTIPPAVLQPENRIASLADESRTAFCTAIVLFFTRRMLKVADVQSPAAGDEAPSPP